MTENKKGALRPPRLIDRFLEWFLPEHLKEDVQGDLQEVFYRQMEEEGEAKARRTYFFSAIRYLRPYFFKRRKNSSYYYAKPLYTDMLRNYFTIATRNLLKYKSYTIINVTGLSLGMACCMLLILFVQHELSYDTYNQHYSQIYRMFYTYVEGDEVKGNIKSPEPLARTLKEEFPQVVKAGRLFPYHDVAVQTEDKSFIEDNLYAADQDILDIFSFRVKKGKKEELLKNPNSVVITEDIADKYFPDIDAVGQTITIFDTPMKVTGVIEKMPVNAHFHANFLISYNTFPQNASTNWHWTDPRTYFLVKEGYTGEAITKAMPQITKKYGADYLHFSTQPLSDIHLYSNYRGELEPNGSITYIYIISIIAAFILVIACINFMNLSTARASLRMKEVGMRKVLGAVKKQLVLQFLSESLFLSFLAFGVALLIVFFALPTFNQLTDRTITLTGNVFLFFIAIVGIVGLGSGLYPAFYLSTFRPIVVLKGRSIPTGSAVFFRKSLVVFQFTMSIVLVIGTLTVWDQLQFIQNKNLGFNQDAVVVIPLRSNKAVERYEALKNALKQNSSVIQVSGAAEYPGTEHPRYFHWPEGASNEQSISLYNGAIGFDYFETMQMQLVEGRFFSADFPADLEESVVINEETARILGYTDNIIGRRIYHNPPDSKERSYRTIIGVVKNFHTRSLKDPIEPLFLIPRQSLPNVLARVQTRNISQTISQLEKDFNEVNPGHPFEVGFIDEKFAQTYASEKRLSGIVTVFTFLAISISCLGLLGLVSFTVDQKTKEIGIRKVLGASVSNIVFMLSKESVRYVILALLIASPIAFYAIHKWLETYAYRVDIKPVTFLMAGGIALLIALLTVSFQSIKAALANPVKSLRSE